MKRMLIGTGLGILTVLMLALASCNRQVIDTTFAYDTAIGLLPDGTVISGEVDSWKDYEDGDQIQVVIDGNTYLFHSANVVLISE